MLVDLDFPDFACQYIQIIPTDYNDDDDDIVLKNKQSNKQKINKLLIQLSNKQIKENSNKQITYKMSKWMLERKSIQFFAAYEQILFLFVRSVNLRHFGFRRRSDMLHL